EVDIGLEPVAHDSVGEAVMSTVLMVLADEAAQGPAANPNTVSSWNSTLLLALLVLLLIVIGIGLILWIDRWRRGANEPICTPEEQLAEFQRLFDKGELSAEEFDRIKRRL